MNKLIQLENIYQKALRSLYSKHEIKSIFKVLIEFQLKKQFKLIQQKKESQPNQVKTCGSTFKNSKNKKNNSDQKNSN